MGAGFIILNAAIRAADRHRKEQEEREKKIAEGYEEETYLSNNTTCYHHYFENYAYKTSASLINWLGIFILMVSAGLSIFVSVWFAISAVVAVVMFTKASNISAKAYDVKYTGTPTQPEFHDGWTYTGKEYHPRYEQRWVKRK